MSQLKFANLARQDLQEIHDYIAEDNEVAAERVIESLETRCRALVDMPNVGRKREDLAPGLRTVVEGNYLILYRGIAGGVYIARVLHTKMDIENMLLEGQ
ncbi:MAG: type II toxin-antitoxin system RelE/ParE family toxin [Candidatus Obscuribacterales bacterium]|nr:type II toxin-antitoxin system RelE/ParE family toxin [Candidatus Obscuribacterales bacterium]